MEAEEKIELMRLEEPAVGVVGRSERDVEVVWLAVSLSAAEALKLLWLEVLATSLAFKILSLIATAMSPWLLMSANVEKNHYQQQQLKMRLSSEQSASKPLIGSHCKQAIISHLTR